MNWRRKTLSALRIKLLALGAGAGLWGALLHESAALVPDLGPWLPDRRILSGAGLGLGLGLFLAPIDALLRGTYGRAARLAGVGAAAGAALGILGAWLQGRLIAASGDIRSALPAETLSDAAVGTAMLAGAGLTLTLALIGAACGFAASGYALGAPRLSSLLSGTLTGGIVGALVAASVYVADYEPWAVLALLVVWGAVLALVLHGLARMRARRWLRLLSAPGEDSIYPLNQGRVTLGKHERNDIALGGFQEIHPYHCELRWIDDHYDIVDNERGGTVLVNYRQVREHTLRAGDLIRVGSALLQYGEATP